MKTQVKKLFLIFSFAAILLAGFLATNQVVYAQTESNTITADDLGLEPIREELGLPETDIRVIAARIIRTALGFLGIVALVLILYGGFVWTTAGGNEENIQKAKKILMNAAIGLIIILSAYAIASFVIRALVGATTGGGGGGGEGGGGGAFSKVFYITSMPGDDLGCGIRNIHPVLVFNKTVDLATVANNLVIRKKDDSSPASGAWHFAAINRQNALVFDPVGDCGVTPVQNDCLDASTTYQIFFANAGNIKSQDALGLNCNIGDYKQKCLNNPSVEFVTGSDVDVEPPTVTIINPYENQTFGQNSIVPVDIEYTDNFGLQNLALFVNGVDISSKNISGCRKTGSTTINWPTGSSPTGTYSLSAWATDNANLIASTTRHVILFPAHCFDSELNYGETQAGPPACGDGCGTCAGGSCTENSDCASGWCEAGFCVDRMRIDGFSPTSGAASTTYVSVSGQYFGDNGGHVYFTKQGGGWTEAFVVSCGAGIDNWISSQIVVKVPANAADGPIMVETASTTGADSVERKFTDITNNDGWGYNGPFTVTNELLPGLCAIMPNSAAPYTDVILLGENFGSTQNNLSGDKVNFSSSTAIIHLWADKSVTARVPALGTGAVSVKLYNENKSSNAIRFNVREVLNSGAPMIESITPDTGAKGEYITITGKNFGNNLGEVWFKLNGGGDAIYGTTDFPADCDGATWSDSRVIIKFPKTGVTEGQDYSVQIKRSSDAVVGPIGATFALHAGDPAPGICKIDPISGPVPFSASSSMKISGEYYTRGGSVSKPYFWLPSASSSNITGRTPATEIIGTTDERSEVRPPNDAQTGPVVMHRPADDKMGNSVPFTVYNCLENNNTCALPGMKCCASGGDAGICKAVADLCAGETRSAGYMWRFNTGPFPPSNRVVERCDGNTDLGLNLPSPSPDIRWTSGGNIDQYTVCRTALVNIEFSMVMNPATINAGNIEIYKCLGSSVTSTDFNSRNTCEHVAGGPLNMTPASYELKIASGDEFGTHQYLQLDPTSGGWEKNSYFQVILKKGIMSASSSYYYGTTTRYLAPQSLKASRPCGADSAYCFMFKTDDQECRLSRVIVTPYEYWTSVLEAPVKYRVLKDNSDDTGSPLYYRGSGLSDQHCIMMDMSGFKWSWSTQRPTYSAIFGPTTGTLAQVTALANTVAVGLTEPDDAVMIRARATKDATSTSAVVTNGLVGWYTFDNDPSGSVADDSSSGNNGALFGDAGHITGVQGSALSLDGSGDYVLLNTLNNFPAGTSARSMCAWGKPNDTDGGWHWMMAYGRPNTNQAMFIGLNGTNDAGVGGAYANDISSPGFWQPNVWHHVCLVFTGATAYLYGDAELKGQMAATGWNLVRTRGYIGAQVFPTAAEFWNGAIDDVRVYNRAISADEVNEIYESAGTAGGSAEDKTGESPLTIDLSHPKVVDYWPKCLEACTNAEIGAKFNIIMVDKNLNTAVKLEKCFDENCVSTVKVSDTKIGFDEADRRYLKINLFGTTPELLPELATNTLYQVTLSRTGTSTLDWSNQLWSGASLSDPSAFSKPMQTEFKWRFRTKTEKCSIDTVGVLPALFQATKIGDRHVYSAEPRSAPDACDPKGQRLNPWTINWDWQSSDEYVAIVQEFVTKGSNPNCTSFCTKTGSDVLMGETIEPLCGNSVVEAGEDCDPPLQTTIGGTAVTSCTLNCLRPGNTSSTCGNGIVELLYGEECDRMDPATKDGCSLTCTHSGSAISTGAEDVSASICGNGMQGFGEDCDLGIAGVRTVSNSALNCSPVCTHLGTALASSWCGVNTSTKAGFGLDEYTLACKTSMSQCGDSFASPDEDAVCETTAALCSDNCLLLKNCSPTTTKTVGDVTFIVQNEGCSTLGQRAGSSLLYSDPSLCGDGKVGIGEDPGCETNFVFSHTFIDPWALAIGIGLAEPKNEVMSADITAIGTQTIDTKIYTEQGSGKFELLCGYNSDEECQAAAEDDNYGVAANSCCYLRPILINTYPEDRAFDVCPNTYIEATFSKVIDPATLPGNVLIAQGYNSSSCPEGTTNVTPLLNLPLADAGGDAGLPWYKKIFVRIATWFKKILVNIVSAEPRLVFEADVYCVSDIAGVPSVFTPLPQGMNSTTSVSIALKAALAVNADYAVLFRPGVKDAQGVSVGAGLNWRFITGEKICELNNLSVNPPDYLFNKSGTSNLFIASSTAANGQRIQSVPGYAWEYVWGPIVNDYIAITATTSSINSVTAKNRNGEVNLTATTNFTDNIFFPTSPVLTGESRIVVFLCENPWPSSSTVAFPFYDPEYDFATYYCMDYGTAGFGDDLPFISSTAKFTSMAYTQYMRRYLFTNTDNKDAVGMQVFSNSGHLSVGDWYAAQGFQGSLNSTKIDGYDAMTDGNNYYIDAIRYPDPTLGAVYSNIYQFSLNNDATAESKEIFKQLMNNLSFNRYWVNDKYCASDFAGTAIDYNMPCENDLDCLAQMETILKNNPISTVRNYICQNSKDKLKRNYQRMKDLRQMSEELNYGRGILALWPMESANYGKLQDVSQNGFEATIVKSSGVSFVSGRDGLALNINGSGELEANKAIGESLAGKSFSLTGWIKTSSANDDNIIDIISASGNGLQLWIGASGKLRPSIGNEGSQLSISEAYCPANPAINDGYWHNFVFLFTNGSTHKIQIYIDGELMCNKTGSYADIPAVAKFMIGSLANDSANFSGSFDDIRVYARILSEDEISTMYSGNLPFKGGYPLMKDNTYLPGQALSVWTNSWQQLANDAGAAMPTDPINKLVKSGTCFVKNSLGQYKACYRDSDCAVVPTDARLSYWSADEGTQDEGTLKNHAVIEGTVGSADGKGHGKAFDFSGEADSKITAADSSEYFAASNGLTIAAWIYPTKKNTATIIEKGGSDDAGKSKGGFVLDFSGLQWNGTQLRFNNGTVRFAVFPDVATNIKYYFIDSQTPLALNQWHYVVARLNKTVDESPRLALYIDGVAVAGNSYSLSSVGAYESLGGGSGVLMATNTLPIEIGSSFNGRIDNIAIYNRFVSNSEITNNLYPGLCINHDPTTGWSAEDRRFSFACNTSSYAYRYSFVSTTKSYLLRTNMEKFTANPNPIYGNNYMDFQNSFLDPTVVNLNSGVCASNDEISSPYNNTCGDGVVGNSEECDPPGRIFYQTGGCPDSASKTTCSSQCKWGATQAVSCTEALGGRCGDGKVQPMLGEICDDGTLNGQNGKCNEDCNGIIITCGNGSLDSGEFCDTVITGSKSMCTYRTGVQKTVGLAVEPVFIFLVDLSGSMASVFTGETKIKLDYIKEELPKVAQKFATPGSLAKMGIVSFTTVASEKLSVKFTSKLEVQSVVNGFTAGGGTKTGEAISWVKTHVIDELSEQDRARPINIVVVTDGDESGSSPTASAIIPSLTDLGILTYILGVDTYKPNFNIWAELGGTDEYIPIDSGDSIVDGMMEIYLSQPCREYDRFSGYSCNWNCTNFGDYCGDGAVQDTEECESDTACQNDDGTSGIKKCVGCHFEGGCEPVAETEGACGNGIVEETEACDRGDDNGIMCTPVYPQISCTYCSGDCKNVITRDVVCGNGIIDSGEQCDPAGPAHGYIRGFFPILPGIKDYCYSCSSVDCQFITATSGEGAAEPNTSITGCASSIRGYCGDGIIQRFPHVLTVSTTAPQDYEQCEEQADCPDCAVGVAQCNNCLCGCFGISL
jgi:cysteine-rich repeat protein